MSHHIYYSWQVYEESTLILMPIWCPDDYIARMHVVLNALMDKTKQSKQTKTNKRLDPAGKKIIVHWGR